MEWKVALACTNQAEMLYQMMQDAGKKMAQQGFGQWDEHYPTLALIEQDIAQKALDVAKNPKISNYYFMVLYKKLIAEIFLIKGDTDASKMYIEKALMIVKQYDMRILKVSLYQLYAKYLEEMVNKKPQNKDTYAQNAMAVYKKALTLITELDIPVIGAEIEKNHASFKAFCQLNNIKI